MELMQNVQENSSISLKNDQGVFVTIRLGDISDVGIFTKSFWCDKTFIKKRNGETHVFKMSLEKLKDKLSSAKTVDEKIDLQDLCKDVPHFNHYYTKDTFPTIYLNTLQLGCINPSLSNIQSVSCTMVNDQYYTKIWLKTPIQDGIFLHSYLTADISFDSLIKKISAEISSWFHHPGTGGA